MHRLLLASLFFSVSYACIHSKHAGEISFNENLPDNLIVQLQDSSVSRLENIFNNINVIRNVNSVGHAQVRNYITSFLTERNWSVEVDHFTENTIWGPITFYNIIGCADKSKKKNLVLACHYESKSIPGFFGSIDSAMPCSIILNLVDLITPAIFFHRHLDISLQVLFFDGEEAFEKWTSTDSIYGSRHLAKKWELENNGADLSKIDLLVLLDLIGASNPSIPNFGYEKKGNYELLMKLERRMRQSNLLRSYGPHNTPYFGRSTQAVIEDDHKPFVKLGVPVLHLIPVPFPPQWHTLNDNAANIDWESSLDFLRIMELFVRVYLLISV